MLQKPPIADEVLVACAQETYGVAVAGLEFLPLGEDTNAGVYRVEVEGGQRLFLKVRRGEVYSPSVTVPRVLRAAGMAEVVAPLPTIVPEPWGTVGEFAVLLYPFVEGVSGWDRMTAEHWRVYGGILRRLHEMRLPEEIARTLPRETFVPGATPRAVVEALLAGEHERGDGGEAARRLAAFVREHREEMARIVRRADELGRALQGRELSFVLCHADCHPGNVMLDGSGRVHVVDWDQPMLAPRERDLMFVVGTGVGGFVEGSPEGEAFFEGYGPVEVDPVALAYYRYEWAMQDIGGFADRIFLIPGMEEETKLGAMKWLDVLFKPGAIADMARRSEALLPPGM
jgi:spectinomycin phosphotransferase